MFFLKSKILLKLLLIQLIGLHFFQINKLDAIIPYYNLPKKEFLQKNGSLLGRKAYFLLSIGQLKEALNTAKLSISLDNQNERLWAILAETQIRNNLIDDALKSIDKGKLLNPKMEDFHFVEGSIYLRQKKLKKSREALSRGLKIQPNNSFVLFELGNIFFMEKNYNKALDEYEKAIKIKSDYWQVINNKGLVFFEKDQKSTAIENFKKAIAIKRNGETLLALAVSLQYTDLNQAINLAKEALNMAPNFVSKDYRKEQLWGDELEKSTRKLFELKELNNDIIFAKQIQKDQHRQ